MRFEHRRTYHKDMTGGRLLLDGKRLGATLEDIGRPRGIKIQDETCIPEGLYEVHITFSNRFQRHMLQLSTNPTTLACELENITFTGIRVHKGTKTAHTAGCILFDGNLDELERLVGEAQKRGEIVLWEITRDTPAVA